MTKEKFKPENKKKKTRKQVPGTHMQPPNYCGVRTSGEET